MGGATQHMEVPDITSCPSASRIREDRPLTPIIKRYRESGSPCRRPLPEIIRPSLLLLTSTK